MSVRKAARQVLTIARRDFVATVFTPVFLLFLFAPVFIGAFSAIGGLGAASVSGPSGRTRIVAIVPDRDARPMAEADTRLRAVFRDGGAPPELTTLTQGAEPTAQARAAFKAHDYDAAAVLYGPLDRPTVLYAGRGARAADYLVMLAGQTLAAERLGDRLPRVEARRVPIERERSSSTGRSQSAFFATFGIFFLTLFLAGQVVGSMAEERNSKVIEVLAAAVPLESVFLGKLLGMFGVAVLFVAFWGTIIAEVGSRVPAAAGLRELAPAVSMPAFVVLFVAYFTMAYLLLGSVFLGVGAQASSQREIQMLSLPITLLQVGMFALASAAAGRPGSTVALIAEVFPLSSPFAMAGRAANSPQLWPHALALAWQLLWVAIFITLGARFFRRGVLQSGSPRPKGRRGRSIDSAVS